MRIRQREIRRARKRHEERLKEARKNGTVAQAPAARPAQTRTLTARPAAGPGQRSDRGGRGGDRGGDRGPRGDNRGGDRGPRGDNRGGDRGPRPEGGPNRPPRESRGGANPAEAVVNTEGAGNAQTTPGEATA